MSRRSMAFLVVVSVCVPATMSTRGMAAPPIDATNSWKFDAGSGTTVVDSVGGNGLSLVGFPANNSQWVNGIVGSAVSFKPNAYGLTNSPIAAANANQFTVSFWLRNDSNSQTNDPHLLSPRNYQFIVWNKAEQPSAGISVGNVRDPHGPLVNVWESYVVGIDRVAGTASIFRDGALVANGAHTTPLFSTPWVFGHHADLANDNAPLRGALDEIQFFNRALSTTEVQSLASRPPQPGLSAHLVATGQSFPGPSPYAVRSTRFYVDVANTQWIAWNRFPELRAVSDARPGEKLIGTQRPEVDDYFMLRITNPLGASMEVAMDRNGSFGEPQGQQAMIFGAAANAPDVVRGDNLSSPSYFNESGAFNSIFTVSGEYDFSFAFRDNFNQGGAYPDVYLLVQTVPEPSSAVLAILGSLAFVVIARRRRLLPLGSELAQHHLLS